MGLELCSWIKPRPGHIVVYQGRGDLLKYSGPLVVEGVEGKDDRAWGVVQKSAVEGLEPGDVVLFTKYDGMSGPSLSPDKVPLVLRGDAVTCVVDLPELERLQAEEKRRERAAAEALAKARESVIVAP